MHRGAGLSPFPRPIAGAPLVESGAYRLIRHPIYSGLVVGAIGWRLVTSSILATGAAGLLFLLLAAKSRREEVRLVAIHPEYGALVPAKAGLVALIQGRFGIRGAAGRV